MPSNPKGFKVIKSRDLSPYNNGDIITTINNLISYYIIIEKFSNLEAKIILYNHRDNNIIIKNYSWVKNIKDKIDCENRRNLRNPDDQIHEDFFINRSKKWLFDKIFNN